MKSKTTLIAGAVGLLFAAGAFAQSNTGTPGAPSTFERNVYQQQRIEQGLQSGALTTREAARLESEQARVLRDQSRALRDGHVSANEQRHVQRMENRDSRAIHRERHDGQFRGQARNQGWHQGSVQGNHWGSERGNHAGWNHVANQQAWNRGQGHGPVAHSQYQRREFTRPVSGNFGGHAGYGRRRG